jgi:hypothetical protein
MVSKSDFIEPMLSCKSVQDASPETGAKRADAFFWCFVVEDNLINA